MKKQGILAILLIAVVSAQSLLEHQRIKQPIISPSFPFLNHPQKSIPLTNQFTLTFEYACRQQVPFNSCTGKVIWNGVEVFTVTPKNYEIISVTLVLQVRVGKNYLQFVATGISDAQGLLIDNVKLIRNTYSSNNIVINGDFEEPRVTTGQWIYLTSLKGWDVPQIQILKGPLFNHRWVSQVAELDSTRNVAITQLFEFNRLYELLRVRLAKCDKHDRCNDEKYGNEC